MEKKNGVTDGRVNNEKTPSTITVYSTFEFWAITTTFLGTIKGYK